MHKISIKRIASIISLTLLTACGDQEKLNDTQKTTTPPGTEKATRQCGTLAYDAKDKMFVFGCDWTNDGMKPPLKTTLIKDYIPKKRQVCDVTYTNGQPSTFICMDQPDTLKTFITRGKENKESFICTGFDDSLGEFIENDITTLQLNKGGKYLLYYKEREGSDSPWFVDSLLVEGEYKTSPPNKITLIPRSLENNLTKITSFNIKDAPNFIKQPKTIEITEYTENGLQATTTRIDGENFIEYNINCKKLKQST